MTAKLFALCCGTLTCPREALIEGGEGTATLPVPSFLIEHPKGRAIYDTGMHPQLKTNPGARVSERVLAMFGFEGYGAEDDIKSKLEAVDRDAAKIDYVINSHLHFDHAGGNGLIPNATIVLQKREWETVNDPDLAVKVGFNKADLDYGHPIKRVDGEHDLFGDGSVVMLPTPGHTPGHQSLKVRTDKGEVVLTGDACYFCRTLRERRLPGARFIYDRDAMVASLDRLEALEQGGAKLIFGHDWEFWQTLPHAPAPVV
jgi:N-acyl homoserine lactone hydrolase